MLLTVDIGNTQTAIGIYTNSENKEPQCAWRIATNKADTTDDIYGKLFPLMEASDLDKTELTCAALSSVVPSLAQAWDDLCRRRFHIESTFCSAEVATKVGLFSTRYPNPQEIGADRVADAIGAKAIYGAPVVVVDFGTATNIEVIDKEGLFHGGIIAPGVITSASALFVHATKLAATALVAPDAAIGTSTEQAIQSGIIFGEAGLVDGLVQRIFSQLGYVTHVVATGGLASLISPHTKCIQSINDTLTLYGLKLLAHALL